MDRPKRYTWYDEYKDVDPAVEYAAMRESAKLLTTVTGAVTKLTEHTRPVIESAYRTVARSWDRIEGRNNYERRQQEYEREMAEYEKWAAENPALVEAEAVLAGKEGGDNS